MGFTAPTPIQAAFIPEVLAAGETAGVSEAAPARGDAEPTQERDAGARLDYRRPQERGAKIFT